MFKNVLLIVFVLIAELIPQTSTGIFFSRFDGTYRYIYSSSLTGSDLDTFSVAQQPKAIAIDWASNPKKLYIGLVPSSGTGKIIRCNVDGSEQEDVVTDLVGINDIELDLSRRKIFWLKNTYNDDRIYKADMDSINKNIVQIYSTTTTNRDLWGIALDPVSYKLWITERGSNCYASYIRRMTMDGGSVTTIKNPVCNPHDIEYFNNKIYWWDNDGLHYAGNDGSGDTLFYSDSDADGIAIDETNNRVYWADFLDNKIKRVDISGSNFQEITTPHGTILKVVIDYSYPPKKLAVRTLIEGFYNTTTDKMIPDTITVVVRDTFPPFAKKDSIKTLLDSTGSSQYNTVNNVSNGVGYYLTIYHRNALETWSGLKPQFINDSLYYTFTNAASKAYGDNQTFKVKNWCIYSGDVNQDGQVSLDDLLAVDSDNQNFASGYLVTDVNGDGQVTLDDLLITDANNQNFVSVQKPGMILKKKIIR